MGALSYETKTLDDLPLTIVYQESVKIATGWGGREFIQSWQGKGMSLEQGLKKGDGTYKTFGKSGGRAKKSEAARETRQK